MLRTIGDSFDSSWRAPSVGDNVSVPWTSIEECIHCNYQKRIQYVLYVLYSYKISVPIVLRAGLV